MVWYCGLFTLCVWPCVDDWDVLVCVPVCVLVCVVDCVPACALGVEGSRRVYPCPVVSPLFGTDEDLVYVLFSDAVAGLLVAVPVPDCAADVADDAEGDADPALLE